MPPFLRDGLTLQQASKICMTQCRAMCCRGPLVLELTVDEADEFRQRAAGLGTEVDLYPLSSGGYGIRFTDYVGDCCPMLDRATFACRIYPHRPERCRQFPQRLTPGCPISGG